MTDAADCVIIVSIVETVITESADNPNQNPSLNQWKQEFWYSEVDLWYLGLVWYNSELYKESRSQKAAKNWSCKLLNWKS